MGGPFAHETLYLCSPTSLPISHKGTDGMYVRGKCGMLVWKPLRKEEL